MSTILRINERSKAAKLFLAYVRTLSFVSVEEEPNYDPKFVEKIKNASKRADYIEINPKDVWGSLNLK